LLHGFLHAIIDQTSSIWLEQLSALSITAIHSLPHNANKPFTMSSPSRTPTHPYRVTPTSSKASSSIRSGHVSFDTREAIDVLRPSKKSVMLIPASQGTRTTMTTSSLVPLQPPPLSSCPLSTSTLPEPRKPFLRQAPITRAVLITLNSNGKPPFSSRCVKATAPCPLLNASLLLCSCFLFNNHKHQLLLLCLRIEIA